MKHEYDVEGHSPTGTDVDEKGLPIYSGVDGAEAIPGESFTLGSSWYARTQRLAGKFSIEQRGIERVPENERTDKSLSNLGTMVSSFTSTITMKCSQFILLSGSRPTWWSPPLPLGP